MSVWPEAGVPFYRRKWVGTVPGTHDFIYAWTRKGCRARLERIHRRRIKTRGIR